MITDPLFYVAAVPAVVLVGLGKGGFVGLGSLALPLMALVTSPVRAAAIMLPILIVQDLVSVWAYRWRWDRRSLAALLPGAVIGIGLGYMLAARVSDAAVELAVGLISISFALRRVYVERFAVPRDRPKPSMAAGWFWGAASGFTSMIANAGGPPFQIYILPQRLPHDIFVGTGVLFFALVNWVKLPPFIALGQLTRENLATSVTLFPVAIAATWAGVVLVRRVPGGRFYTIIYALLVLVGLKLAWDGFRGLF